MKIHKEPTFSCEQCEQQFHTQSQLSKHMKVVHNEPTYCCKTCEETFHTKPALNDHIKVHHLPSYY